MLRATLVAAAIAGAAASGKTGLGGYSSAAMADIVSSLPGLETEINFNHFSGLVDIPGTQKKIHYWFVEASDVDPATAPVVVWTNGGPGCSGLLGMLTEQGPFRPDGDKKVAINPYAWNKIANVVFIEQPAGVGFSYSDNKDEMKTNDDIASADAYAFLQGWYARFPQYAANDLYISSESYGGHYAPLFTNYIVEQNKKGETYMPIKGFAVGNPFNDWAAGQKAMYETFWGHQIISRLDWDKYQSTCVNSEDPLAPTSQECEFLELKLQKEIGNLNVYALDYPVCTASSAQSYWLLKQTAPKHLRDQLLSTYEPCEDNYATQYMNDADVKAALHVNGTIEWEECSTQVRYDFSNEFLSMSKYYPKLVNDGMKILVYSGDNDAVCGTVGTQRWIYDLGFTVSSSWKAWYLDGQTAGWVTKFNTHAPGKFSFQVVHGAGHEVPTYRPEAALDLFRTYLDESIFA